MVKYKNSSSGIFLPFSFILVFIYSNMNDCFQFKTGGSVEVK